MAQLLGISRDCVKGIPSASWLGSFSHIISSHGTNRQQNQSTERRPHGYGDMDFFKVRTLAIHEAKVSSTG